MRATLYTGSALDVLKTLPDGVARCCVTSPPYWGLRDYGTATWEGGEAGCDHGRQRNVGASTLRNDGRERIGTQSYEKTAATVVPFRDVCGKCGARRIDAQLGLERTPEEYVARMVEVFREVRRVLADDGTLWLNLGDSYCSTAPGTQNAPMPKGSRVHAAEWANHRPETPSGMKPKDLVGIPWSVAFALRNAVFVSWCVSWYKNHSLARLMRMAM